MYININARLKVSHLIVGIALLISLATVMTVYAGDPNSDAAPGSSSWYTLEDLYNRLNDGTAGSQNTTFDDPSVGPGTGTMYSINEIMGKMPQVDDTNGASPGDVLSGKTYWGLTSGDWATQTGTYAGGGSSYSGPVLKTGQTNCYDATSEQTCPVTGFPGQDGDYQKGVAIADVGRFVAGNGVVTDTLTGLVWLKNANCTTVLDGVTFDGEDKLDWGEGLKWSNALANGNCGLTDSSSAGDWRLPNVRELHSLVDYQSPALPSGHLFNSVQSGGYWSGSTVAGTTSSAWFVSMDGGVRGYHKVFDSYVWPVRGGQ
ncbi:DUF1566 domain-containing protein [Anaerolineales bacterium HSG6]|nr:DUF1566 domain-containing protein [Anaerolineales bacterium HSG6]